jgi:hypothetical protein
LREARDSFDPEKRRSHTVANYVDQTASGSSRVIYISRGIAGTSGYLVSGAVHAEDQQAVGDGIKSRIQKRNARQLKLTGVLLEIAATLSSLPPDTWERCQRDMLSVVRRYSSMAPPPATRTVAPPEICLWGMIFDTWEKRDEASAEDGVLLEADRAQTGRASSGRP